jgi:hypothetical protein
VSWRDSFKIFILNTKLVIREPEPDLKLRVAIGSGAETCDSEHYSEHGEKIVVGTVSGMESSGQSRIRMRIKKIFQSRDNSN